MRIKIEKEKIILYNNNLTNINFKNIDLLEEYFKKIFLKLKKITNVDSGFYIINIYLDEYYGAVIEIIEDSFVKNCLFDNQIDMKINVIETDFLYECDIDFYDKNIFDIYLKNKKIYLKIKNKISDLEMMNLLENSRIIYDTEKIFLTSKKL